MESRSGAMDVAVKIPATSSTEATSDNSVAIIMPGRSPSIKIPPLGLQDETCKSPRPSLVAKKKVIHLSKKVMSEFLGTLLLLFILLSALIINEMRGGVLGLVGVAATGGLAAFVIVASLFHVSGSHLNPAVSVALAMFGYLPWAHLAPYVAAQVAGSVAASFAVKAVYRPANLGVVATVPTLGTAEAFLVEFVITFVLLFAIVALATDPKAVKELVAVAAGAAVMMNALISAESTGASMNPARTLGPAIATGTYTKIWIYMVAPPLGAIAGTGAYVALKH